MSASKLTPARSRWEAKLNCYSIFESNLQVLSKFFGREKAKKKAKRREGKVRRKPVSHRDDLKVGGRGGEGDKERLLSFTTWRRVGEGFYVVSSPYFAQRASPFTTLSASSIIRGVG